MNKVLLEVTRVESEKHEGVQMDAQTKEALKKLGLITQTVTLKPVNRNSAEARDNEEHFDPIKLTLPGNELSIGDRFMLELTPVR